MSKHPLTPQKSTFDAYVASCTPLLKLPAFEADMRRRVCEIASRLVGFDYASQPESSLVAFMREDVDLLKVLLKMTNLSQEKFKRIIAAERHARGDYGNEWDISRIHRNIVRDDPFAESIADLFLEGRDNPTLAEHVADFYLDQLAFPEKWADLLRDRDFAARIAREMLAGDYSDKKGDEIERIVSDRLDVALSGTGLTSVKGRVPFLGKEVDLAIPNLENPEISIMISYMETTSSSQTTRANEQETMFSDVNRWNSRNHTNRAFVNVVDGGGWLARRPDLRRLHRDSHYCLSINMLDQLDDIVAYHATR